MLILSNGDDYEIHCSRIDSSNQMILKLFSIWILLNKEKKKKEWQKCVFGVVNRLASVSIFTRCFKLKNKEQKSANKTRKKKCILYQLKVIIMRKTQSAQSSEWKFCEWRWYWWAMKLYRIQNNWHLDIDFIYSLRAIM